MMRTIALCLACSACLPVGTAFLFGKEPGVPSVMEMGGKADKIWTGVDALPMIKAAAKTKWGITDSSFVISEVLKSLSDPRRSVLVLLIFALIEFLWTQVVSWFVFDFVLFLCLVLLHKGTVGTLFDWIKRRRNIKPENLVVSSNASLSTQSLSKTSEHDFDSEFAEQIVAAGKCSDAQRCREIVDQMQAKFRGMLMPKFHCNAIQVFATMGELATAEVLLLDLMVAGGHPDSRTVNVLIGEMIKADDIDRAEMWMREVVALALDPGYYLSFKMLLRAFAQRGDISRAEDFIWTMEKMGHKIDKFLYSILINGAAYAGRPKAAERAFRCMMTSHVEVDARTYATLAKSWVRAGRFDRAEYWLNCMTESGFLIDRVSFTSMISAYGKVGNASMAEVWMTRMLQAGVDGDDFAYNTLVYAWSVQGDLARAALWIKRMEDCGIVPNVVTYNSIINGCARHDGVDSAEHWFNRLREKGITADAMTYTPLLTACANCGRVDRAEYWIHRMQEEGIGIFRVAYNIMIKACSRANDVDRAGHWMTELEKSGHPLNIESLTLVIHTCSRNGEPAQAEHWLRKLIDAGLKPSRVTCRSMMNAWTNVGQSEEAARWNQYMQENGK